jgi:hypothetical protein
MRSQWVMSRLSLLFSLMPLLSGCGYAFQNSKNPLAEKEGVRKIYVKPLVNNTYKPGIENVVYNALIRTLSVHRRVVLVNRADDADAELSGSVGAAGYGMSAAVNANQLLGFPRNGGALGQGDQRSTIQIAYEYSASLTCTFSLTRVHHEPGRKDAIWGAGFSRNKLFNAANQLGPQGDTSALINESEFDRALSDLAASMMDDVHESMLAMF